MWAKAQQSGRGGGPGFISGLGITWLAQHSTLCPVESSLAFHNWRERLASPALRCASSAMISLPQLLPGRDRPGAAQHMPLGCMNGSNRAMSPIAVRNLDQVSLTGCWAQQWQLTTL